MSEEKDDEIVPTNIQGDLSPIITAMNNKLMKNSEQIAILKTQDENIYSKLSSMEHKVDGVANKIDEGNKENKEIFNQLLNHHLGIKRENNTSRWKLTTLIFTSLLSGGGLFYLVLELFIT